MSDDKGRGPAWRVIADALRSDVADEVYPPGSPLPGESPLAERYGVSRPTVRRAINSLVGEGLLTVTHGRGTFVRQRPDRRVILINDEATPDLLGDDHGLSPQGWLTEPHPRESAPEALITSASRSEAEALGMRTGTMILRRTRYLRHRVTRQTILATSVTPAYLLGMGFEPGDEGPDEAPFPAPGAQGARVPEDPPEVDHEFLDTAPDEVDESRPLNVYETLRARGTVRFVSTVTARMPVGDEGTDLYVPVGTAVLEVRRTMTDEGGHPLEATTVTVPADRFEVASAPEWLPSTRATGSSAAAVLRL